MKKASRELGFWARLSPNFTTKLQVLVAGNLNDIYAARLEYNKNRSKSKKGKK